jgi:hypothetical protein
MLAISHGKAAQPSKDPKEKKTGVDYETRKVPSECIEDIVSPCEVFDLLVIFTFDLVTFACS